VSMDEYYMMRRGIGPTIPGLIRIDRALLYVRQQIKDIIRTLQGKSTKGAGDTIYQLRGLARHIAGLCVMSGDRPVAEKIFAVVGELSTRTPRTDAIRSLQSLLQELESYQPLAEVDNVEALRERIDMLEQQLVAGPDEQSATLDTSEESTVFVIMPFNPEFNDVWKGGILRAAKAESFVPIRVDMINRSTNITEDIVESIAKCRLAIVDVTGNNPNVMFELGYAMAKDKQNIIISQSVDYLPFDIRNIRTIVYSNTWNGIEELRGKIQEFLKEFKPASASKKKTSKGA